MWGRPVDEKQETQSTNKHTANLVHANSAQPMAQRTPSPQTTHLTATWRLLFKIGEQSKRVLLKSTAVVVGRAVDSDPAVEFDLTPYGAYHFGVSRRHAVLSLNEGYLYIEDLGSTNGTRINGFQLTPKQKYRLRDGDEIEFARLRTNIRFERPGA